MSHLMEQCKSFLCIAGKKQIGSKFRDFRIEWGKDDPQR